jgi:sugar (pentulose or hexulose) kinase
MIKTEQRIAFATLDIGTSQIKLGVYCPFLSDKIILINNLPNELIYGTSGSVTADYTVVHEASFTLFKELGAFLEGNRVERLYLGICGHVSSLIEWNRISGTPPATPFPIWLDTTSYDSLDEYNQVMGDGKSNEMIGTFLPSGTNWLFTKLLHRRKSGFNHESIFLQVGDAIFYELSGQYHTHFSSQISMVNLEQREYQPRLKDYLDLHDDALPVIEYAALPLDEAKTIMFGFPAESFVFPAMADLYTSLYGLRLNNREGFMLANTSEQAGAFYLTQPKALDNFLSITFDKGFVNYGSTNTGGNILSWFVTNVLNKKITSDYLDDLTDRAMLIEPAHTPIILPYLQGERAPLWNPALTASILELKSSHTEVHLFRAILESIAFARRQCFEQLGMEDLHQIKIAGGSSKNNLWNSIRATVLNKRLAVADEKELAMAGIVDYMMEMTESDFGRPVINFSIIEPDKDLIGIYDVRYAKFIKYQQMSEPIS